MVLADQTSQPVKAIHRVLEPDGKQPKNARVQCTFLQAFLLHESQGKSLKYCLSSIIFDGVGEFNFLAEYKANLSTRRVVIFGDI
jgi:hypothetical protein